MKRHLTLLVNNHPYDLHHLRDNIGLDYNTGYADIIEVGRKGLAMAP
jgi:hypothetical protein